MSAIFQGLVKADGRVTILNSIAPPGGSIPFRGMRITENEEVVGTPDTGQSRVFINGIAFESSTGILLFSQSAGPFNAAPGGLLVDAAGAVVIDSVVVPDVIHQGVGLLDSGRLCATIQALVNSYLLLEIGDKFLLEDDSGALLLEV